jgi:hypothetical protein
MISESWFAIDSDDSPLRNREITTVMLIGGCRMSVQVSIHLDDVGHRAAAGLDLRLQALQRRTRLRLEIAGVHRRPFRAIGDLVGDEEDRLGAA